MEHVQDDQLSRSGDDARIAARRRAGYCLLPEPAFYPFWKPNGHYWRGEYHFRPHAADQLAA